eukprot:CAMPEP_0183493264 /NCGR_PEP_ID=MMETSP0370-20130417/183357_1 /TAXON_ID=268820 /ORGANISM="Peridinium aciculiferum, Strain PAER-2" /LENGTH=1097 /DNA_ID=CAMNT_0025686605 /DNA_START=63 /DNA_END=3353 /DNA_ORIENTATION=-
MAVRCCLAAALVLAAGVHGSSEQAAASSNMNPLRKVVTLLQAMQKKVTAEGEAEKELFDKFMCYCKTGGGDLSSSISSADSKVPAVGSEIEASEDKLTQAKANLKDAQTDRSSAKAAMAEASALREKEASAFASSKADADTNIAAITKAVAALEKGASGSFLQTQNAQILILAKIKIPGCIEAPFSSRHFQGFHTMAVLRSLAAALLLTAGAHGVSEQAAVRNNMNPIRKVVTLLQAMQKKVTAEGEAEKELYEKFMCYCKTGGGDLSSSISGAESKVPAVGSAIEASEDQLTQAKADFKGAQTDRSSAEASMAEAGALREKEASSFASSKAEYDTNIAAITKAVAALEKGASGSFLQTQNAQILRNLAADGKVDMLDADRQDLVSFLSQGSEYSPQSGAITGILKQLGDEMSKDLSDVTATEESSVKTYEELMAAKEKEVAALSQTVETKTAQIGELGVSIVQMKEDLSDTQAALLEDNKFLAELEKSCSTKTQEWDERSKTRAEELVALADTIKVLNDDDALDLFKKVLPSAGSSLVQVSVSTSAQRARALGMIRSIHKSADAQPRPQLDLLALTLSGKRALSAGGFDKVIKMCDDMVAMLKQEQLDDTHKQEYCAAQFDTADDKKKALERAVADEGTAIESAKEGIDTLIQEIAALEAGIKALDKTVAEATEQRKAENTEYKELMASDGAAKELLGFAKNRLNKFYNPKLYKEAPKQELTEEERILANNGGTPPPTEAPGGIAGTGVTALVQISAHNQLDQGAAPAPPPSTWAAYTTKSDEGTGVISMIDLLIKDLDKEMTEAETEEKNAQADYQATMSDAADKRAQDSNSLTEKDSSKADLETALQGHGESKKATVSELMATDKYISSLHAECDELMASDGAAKELLGFARNRLNKFYNPKLYKAAPKQELTEEERILVNNGGTPPPSEAPGGIAGTGVAVFVQISAHSQLNQGAAPPPPPATWDAYATKSEESTGVIAMIDLLIKDMDKEMTEAETEEKNAQVDYQATMSDAADKRAQDSKSLTEKDSFKADFETALQGHGEAQKSAVSELMATDKYISSLHAECDWLLQYFDVRKAARADEVDALTRAKAV